MFIDFPEVHGVIVEGMGEIRIPEVVTIRPRYDADRIMDIPAHLRQRMMGNISHPETFAGKRICITAGSRGIAHLDVIIRTICEQLKLWGARPFVIPAMGSHGGGTAEGQVEILKGYNIVEEFVGAPVLSSMEVVQYGKLANGTPLFCDKNAFESDGIVVLNKQAPHTDFRGPNESGLAKMIAIGLGKHMGASMFHMQGFPQFGASIPEAAEIFLKTNSVAFGVGIVQNAYHEICTIEVAPPGKLLEMDSANLAVAKEKLPRFKFDDLDVLVLDEIGKNISGYGHDPNITGRANGDDESFKSILKLKKMVILSVTEESHHNGTGIAEADITTRRCMRDIDWAVVWTNLITSPDIQGCKMPMYANNDREAILLAIRACNNVDFRHVRLARVKNTAEMGVMEVSTPLYETIKDRSDIKLVCGPHPLSFDQDGYLAKGIKES
jgi:hypothetical protein